MSYLHFKRQLSYSKENMYSVVSASFEVVCIQSVSQKCLLSVYSGSVIWSCYTYMLYGTICGDKMMRDTQLSPSRISLWDGAGGMPHTYCYTKQKCNSSYKRGINQTVTDRGCSTSCSSWFSWGTIIYLGNQVKIKDMFCFPLHCLFPTWSLNSANPIFIRFFSVSFSFLSLCLGPLYVLLGPLTLSSTDSHSSRIPPFISLYNCLSPKLISGKICSHCLWDEIFSIDQ